MSSKKIIFICDHLLDARIKKRLSEFASHGYTNVLYGFERNGCCQRSEGFDPIIMGDLGSNDNKRYLNRLKVIRKGIKRICTLHKGEDVTYYLFGLQIAMIFRTVSRKPYIYEEADLVQTYMGRPLLVRLFNRINNYILRHSIINLFTSEGFLQYHYGNRIPAGTKYHIVPNKLTPAISDVPRMERGHAYDPQHIVFAFVGGVRFESTVTFLEYVSRNFPQHELHIFGVVQKHQERIDKLVAEGRCVNHGRFANPVDLPNIYSQIDYVISTYDVAIPNVKFAEPNKLYESIYFRVPLIASEGTFLASKVTSMGIGLALDALDEAATIRFVKSLDNERYAALMQSLEAIPKENAIDKNDEMFATLATLM